MKTLRITALSALIALVVGFVACGGGASSNPTAPSNPTASSQPGTVVSSVTLGDTAADNVVSFEITITSLQLDGQEMLSGARRLELTHLSATVAPLSIGHIASGTHTATIQWSSPELTFMDAAGALHEIQPTASGTVTISGVTVGASASVLNFDLDVAKSITVDAAGNITLASQPAFSFTSARSIGEAVEAETGEIEDMLGAVISASPKSVTITPGKSGNSLTFDVNASTRLVGIANAGQLVVGQVIRIEGTIQTDGTIVAKEIEAESADGHGAEAEGLVTSVGATNFTMIVHDASGASTSSSDLGKTVSVDASSANFSIGTTKINASGFGFASMADLHKGQRVEADSDTPKSAAASPNVSDDGSFNGAKRVKLEQQALTGSVSNISGANFTLTVPGDSAFAKLAGTTTVQVVNNGAQMKNGVTVSSGATVRVRGLLFAPAGNYTLAAGRITTP